MQERVQEEDSDSHDSHSTIPIDLDADLEASGTIFSSMINILNTILGSGMLAMPNAVASLGYVPAPFVILAFGFFSAFGLFLLTECAALVGRKSSFSAISKITYPNASIFFDLAIAIKCFGVAVSYLIVIGKLMPNVVRNMMPAYTKGPLVFIYHPVVHEDTAPFDVQNIVLARLPVFVFAFTCHQNIFPVYNELKENTPRRINVVSAGSILISSSLYMVVGILGYLMFGKTVESNMLENFTRFPQLVTIANLTLSICFLFTYPLQCHPCRASLDKVINKTIELIRKRDTVLYENIAVSNRWSKYLDILSPEMNSDHTRTEMSSLRFFLLSFFIMISSLIIALLVSDITKVLGFVGATGSTTICYILPGLFYLKIKEGQPWDTTKTLALLLLNMGIVLMPVCVISVLFFGGSH